MMHGDVDAAVRLEIYRSFVDRGCPPTPPELAEVTGATRREVEDSLRRLADARVLVLAPGTPYVWMANPFSAIPTPFEVEIGGRSWYGNCIWDALGVVAMLGGAGSVATTCPDCGARLLTTIDDRRVAEGEGVVHFAVPAAHWWDDIGFN